MSRFETRLRNIPFFLLFGILVFTVLVYAPSLHYDFTDWDDRHLVTDNPRVHSWNLHNFLAIARQRTDIQPYIPLTTMTYALEWHFFKGHPFIYKFNNLLLHLCVVGLIFKLALMMKLPLLAAGTGALIFALHPIHVESVAWIAERKDVLYGLFYLLAVISYLRYQQSHKLSFYLWSLLCGLLSMIAKPMAVSLPLILLLLDWWNQRPFSRKMVLEKLPYLCYILPLAWITYSTWMRNPVQDIPNAMIIFVWCLTFPLKKFFFPAVLLPHYVLPQPVGPWQPEYLLALVILLAVLALVLRLRRQRVFLFACLYFLLSIFFLIRYDDVEQAGNLSIVADRFMYLPSLGFCLWLGYLVDRLFHEYPQRWFRPVTGIAVAVVILGLGVKTSQQTRIWTNSLTLWDHVLTHADHDFIAHINRGTQWARRGDHPAAIQDYHRALAMRPHSPKALVLLGKAYLEIKKTDLSLQYLEQAIAADPTNVQAHLAKAVLFYKDRQLSPSLATLNHVIRFSPGNAEAYHYRGIVLDSQGEKQQALKSFNTAIALDPLHAEAYVNRGIFFYNLGQKKAALENFNLALAIDPHVPNAHRYRWLILSELGRVPGKK